MLEVRVKVAGARPSTIKAANDATVQMIINETGHGNDGWTIHMNGRPADLETLVTAGCLITLSNRVKGGQPPVIIRQLNR